jgi:hypothetical protein
MQVDSDIEFWSLGNNSGGGGGGGGGGVWEYPVAITGTIDGSNPTFAISAVIPVTATVFVIKNGLTMEPGVGYTRTGSAITYQAGFIPQPGDTQYAAIYV